MRRGHGCCSPPDEVESRGRQPSGVPCLHAFLTHATARATRRTFPNHWVTAMPDLADLLIQLQENVSRYPTRAIFRPPASDDEIAAAEAAMDVGIPESYRRFLKTFNGGFISLCGDSSETDWNERNAAWNSNLLFGTERIVKEYTRWRQIWQLDMGWSGDWPYVPFCQTEGQELLVFAAQIRIPRTRTYSMPFTRFRRKNGAWCMRVSQPCLQHTWKTMAA